MQRSSHIAPRTVLPEHDNCDHGKVDPGADKFRLFLIVFSSFSSCPVFNLLVDIPKRQDPLGNGQLVQYSCPVEMTFPQDYVLVHCSAPF